MNLTEIILLSIAASADALSVGASYGFRKIQISLKAKSVIGAVSLTVTSAAVFLGNILSSIMPELFVKIIGVLILFGLGVYVLAGAVLNKEPVECDIDHSSSIDCREAFFMGLALSADSFSVGISAGLSNSIGLLVPVLCGTFQMVFLCTGEWAVRHIVGTGRCKPKYLSILSGIILLATALFRFFL